MQEDNNEPLEKTLNERSGFPGCENDHTGCGKSDDHHYSWQAGHERIIDLTGSQGIGEGRGLMVVQVE